MIQEIIKDMRIFLFILFVAIFVFANSFYILAQNSVDLTDDIEENDCEQSDMVAILLNIAYIPDFAAEIFHFGRGFNQEYSQSFTSMRKTFIEKVQITEKEYEENQKGGGLLMNKLIKGLP